MNPFQQQLTRGDLGIEKSIWEVVEQSKEEHSCFLHAEIDWAIHNLAINVKHEPEFFSSVHPHATQDPFR